jgi:hypothetical protein
MGEATKEQPTLITNTLNYITDNKGVSYSSYTTTDWNSNAVRSKLDVLHSSQLVTLLDEVLPSKLYRISSSISDWSGYYQWTYTETDPITLLLMRKYNQLRDLYIITWKEYYYLRPSGLVNLRRDVIYSSATAVNRAPYHPSGLRPNNLGMPGTTVDLYWNECYPGVGGDPDDYSPYNLQKYEVYLSPTNPPDDLLTTTFKPSYQAKGLGSLRNYYWRVIAYDNYGVSSLSYVATFLTGP